MKMMERVAGLRGSKLHFEENDDGSIEIHFHESRSYSHSVSTEKEYCEITEVDGDNFTVIRTYDGKVYGPYFYAVSAVRVISPRIN